MKEQMNSQSDVEERSSHPAYSSEGEPGLYFVGLHFQYALSSDVLPGVGRDATPGRLCPGPRRAALQFRSRLQHPSSCAMLPVGRTGDSGQ